MKDIIHASLFSGIGGFDYAAKLMGYRNLFHCEWMDFPRRVLDFHFPESDSLKDICKIDFKKYANKVTILTGGFPCQPFSTAGKRKGTEDERYLWGEMLRAVQEIKPEYVIAENVFGITNIDGGLVFEQVCLDLENQGYEVQPFIIPAVSKNAPHRRDRVWFIAYRNCNGFNQRNCKDEINTSERGINAQRNFEQSIVNGNITNTKNIRQKYALENRELERRRFGFGNQSHTWSSFPLESPICGGDDGLPSKLDGITFSKWRSESIKGYGNAIVPQVAMELFKIIEAHRQL
jgi:DNA (cytosine-5)-methyltransferase 1